VAAQRSFIVKFRVVFRRQRFARLPESFGSTSTIRRLNSTIAACRWHPLPALQLFVPAPGRFLVLRPAKRRWRSQGRGLGNQKLNGKRHTGNKPERTEIGERALQGNRLVSKGRGCWFGQTAINCGSFQKKMFRGKKTGDRG